MARVSSIVSYLFIFAFVIASMMPSHIGHFDVADAHSSHHGPSNAHDLEAVSLLGDASGDHNHSKKECDHANDEACNSGHCCYPVPVNALTHASGDESYRHLNAAFSNLRDERLEPPPPRSS